MRRLQLSSSQRDAVTILLVWAASIFMSVFVEPRHYEISTYERLYYSVYDVAVGAFVGFYLFDRTLKDGLVLIALRACCAILLGTLINEVFVETVVFRTGPINGEGLYYGLTDAASAAGLFLLIRLGQRVYAVNERAGPEAQYAPAEDSAEAGCFFARVAGGTRRLYAADVLYMEAERDFTRIVCVTGEHFVSESLKSLVDKASGFGLVRVHKSFAVNLSRVDRLSRSQAELGDRRVPVGRRYGAQFAESWRARSHPVAAH